MTDTVWDIAQAHALLKHSADVDRLQLLERIDVLASLSRCDVLRMPNNASPEATDIVKQDDEVGLTFAILYAGVAAGLQDTLWSLPGDASVLVLDSGTHRLASEDFDYPSLQIGVAAFDWNDDFAAARNACARIIGKGWVVFIDADEALLPSAGTVLRRAIRHLSTHPYSARIAISVRIWDGTHGTASRIGRAFRADGDILYQGAVHEELRSRTSYAPLEVALNCDFLHAGYSGTSGDARATRNKRILDEIIASGSRRAKYYFYRARDAERLRSESATTADLEAAAHLAPENIPFQGRPTDAAIVQLVTRRLDRGRSDDARDLLDRYSPMLESQTTEHLGISVSRAELDDRAVAIRSRAAAAALDGGEGVGLLLDQIGTLSLLLGDFATAEMVANGVLGEVEPTQFAQILAALAHLRPAVERGQQVESAPVLERD